jgi:hypothetical protein
MYTNIEKDATIVSWGILDLNYFQSVTASTLIKLVLLIYFHLGYNENKL